MVCVSEVVSKEKGACEAHQGDGQEAEAFHHARKPAYAAANGEFELEEITEIVPDCFS